MAIKRSITNEPGWVTIVRPSDTNRTSTTVVANDEYLLFEMEASSSYFIDMFAVLYIRATPDFKYSLTAPTGFFRAMQVITAWTTTVTLTSITAIPANVVISASGEGYGYLRITGPYTATDAGTFAFQWAQNTSDGSNAATVVAGSSLRYFKF